MTHDENRVTFDQALIESYPALLSERQASELQRKLVGFGAEQTLRIQRVNGCGAPFRKLGRAVRYERDALVEHLRQRLGRRFRSTSEYPRESAKA